MLEMPAACCRGLYAATTLASQPIEDDSCTIVTSEVMRAECLGWSRSRADRFVEPIDKRPLEEHCAAVQSTVQTQVLVSRAENSFVTDRVHLPNVQAPTWLRELDSPRSEKIICIGEVSLERPV